VCNRPDGTVEVEAEGPVQLLGELQLWCARGPMGADVSGVTSHVIPCNGSDWFEIRR
jgi:acylphosphatase